MNIIEQENIYRRKKHNDTTYMFKHPDEWGYFSNLHHQMVLEEYHQFRKERGIPSFAPLSDDERHEFDCLLANKYKKEWNRWQESFLKKAGGLYGRNTTVSAHHGLENCTADSA